MFVGPCDIALRCVGNAAKSASFCPVPGQWTPKVILQSDPVLRETIEQTSVVVTVLRVYIQLNTQRVGPAKRTRQRDSSPGMGYPQPVVGLWLSVSRPPRMFFLDA